MNRPNQLFHYSSHPIKELRQDFHDKHRTHIPVFQKPHGLWFSVEDYGEDDQNWKSWCEGEKFRLEALKYKYQVYISKKAKILYMSTTEELQQFSLKYKQNDPEDFYKFTKDRSRAPYVYMIDWDRLMQEYDGIVIAPYNWGCRLMNPTTSWYYGWDCASGCIWNMEVIKNLLLVSIQELPPQAEETEKDLQLADLVQLGRTLHLEHTE